MSTLPPHDERARRDPLTGQMVYPEQFENGYQDGDWKARPRLLPTRDGHECPIVGPISKEDRRAGIQDGNYDELVGVPGSSYALQPERFKAKNHTASDSCGCRGRCQCPSGTRSDAESYSR